MTASNAFVGNIRNARLGVAYFRMEMNTSTRELAIRGVPTGYHDNHWSADIVVCTRSGLTVTTTHPSQENKKCAIVSCDA